MLTITTEKITPSIATAYLESNTRNRPIKRKHVITLADAMSRGEWRTTHEGIAFDSNGDLIDGQHRLCAVVMSGATVYMAVARGCDPDSFAVIGDGARRSSGDVLHLAGEINAKKLGSAVFAAILGTETRTASKAEIAAWMRGTHAQITRDIVSAMRDEHAAVTGAIIRSVVAGVFSHAQAIDFARRYQSGDWDGATSPICALKARITKHKHTRVEQYLYAVRSITMYAEGKRAPKIYRATCDFEVPNA